MAVIDQETKHRRPHSQALSGPFLECDLMREVDQLHREPEWESGQNARTLVRYDDLRIVLTALKPRKKVRVTRQTVECRFRGSPVTYWCARTAALSM